MSFASRSQAICLKRQGEIRTSRITVELCKSDYKLMKEAVKQGFYLNLSELVREAVRKELRRLRLRKD